MVCVWVCIEFYNNKKWDPNTNISVLWVPETIFFVTIYQLYVSDTMPNQSSHIHNMHTKSLGYNRIGNFLELTGHTDIDLSRTIYDLELIFIMMDVWLIFRFQDTHIVIMIIIYFYI